VYATSAGGFINPALTNDGTVSNGGSLVDDGVPWTQSGGSVSGNAVVMQNAALIDSVGSGAFLFDYDTGAISGTIPAGQTITVQGETYVQNGDGYSGTSLALNAGGNTAPVTNDGTVVLDAPGSGGSSGGPAYLTSGTLDNDGTVISQTEDTNWPNAIQANINNSATGNVDLNDGTMYQEGSTLTNSGTVTVAQSGLWVLDKGGAFVNTAAGMLDIDIASAKASGGFQLNDPCCGAAGAFTAGGILSPTLVGGYVPAVNQLFSVWSQGGGLFTGTFANVTGSFVGDYGKTSATYGVIYNPTATASTVAKLSVGKVSSGRDGLSVRLTCAKGSGDRSLTRVTGTVTEHLTHGKLTATSASLAEKKTKKKTTRVVTVASATSTLKAGTSRTLTLKLNKTGRALLSRFHKLTIRTRVSVAGKTVKTVKIVVSLTAKGHREIQRQLDTTFEPGRG
jgi:hypothetical protein